MRGFEFDNDGKLCVNSDSRKTLVSDEAGLFA